MSNLCDITATDLRHMIGRKDISPVELVEASIDRIEMVDSSLNAVVTKNYEAARKAAKTAEKNVLDGDLLGLLHGLPVGIKDLEATANLRTTLGSKLYADHVPTADLGVVANVRNAGGIILGKTNTPEFGAGANTRETWYLAQRATLSIRRKPVVGHPVDPQLLWRLAWCPLQADLTTAAACAHPPDFAV